MSPDPGLDVLEKIRQSGVRTLCVCPGGRNADWVRQCASPDCGFEVLWFPEERSAAFFALGRIRSTRTPVAVCTTSGTAAAELLPATMEAFCSGFPLILLTADRPRRYRGSGAPQAAIQPGLFGLYAPIAYDLEGAETLPGPLPVGQAPIHINVCFEEPNAHVSLAHPPQVASHSAPAREAPSADLGPFGQAVAAMKRPLAIVGALEADERCAVERYLAALGAPVYLESLSGLRASQKLEPLKLRVADGLLARAEQSAYPPDGVIRIGGVPTHRIWRDIEALELPVVSVSRLPFSGLGRPSVHFQADLNAGLPEPLASAETSEELIAADRAVYDRLLRALQDHPDSEPALFRALAQTIPSRAQVYLGNSLPVREWDLAASWEDRELEVRASRGLNGIDGQVSTFLGMCEDVRSNWAILGDLTTLYDLVGPWPFAQLPQDLDATIVVVNNCGGKIFDRMFPEMAFQNRHTLSFQNWAAMWGIGYERAETAQVLVDRVSRPNRGLTIIEALPDASATDRFWSAYREVLA